METHRSAVATYYSSGFEKLFLDKIGDPKTHEFAICTGYTRHSYIERFDDPSIDPDSNFSTKISRLLIGDPLGHTLDEREKIDSKLAEKALFCNKLRFNKSKRAFNPIIHSKIIIGFDENKEPIWAMVGSNNFTNSGMRDKNEESMLVIENTRLLKKIESHFNKIHKMCDRLGSLNLDRIIGKPIDGGYSIKLISESGQAIDPIFIIQVLIEDEGELDQVKSAESVLLDCIDSSELLDETSNGLYRPFIIVFVDNVKLRECGNIIVRYGVTRASVAISRGADGYSGSPDGYIRYSSNTIADFDLIRVFDPDNNHTHDIPFLPIASSNDFDGIVWGASKKEKMAEIINRFLNAEKPDEIEAAYSLVSTNKKMAVSKISKSSLNVIDDGEEIRVDMFEEIIERQHFDSLEGKTGYLGQGSLSGKDAHEKKEYSLKSDIVEDVSIGLKEMKKEYPGEYFTIVKSAVDFDAES